MKLLNKQKNQLFDIIESNGLSPAMFTYQEWAVEGKGIVETRILVKNTDYYFYIMSGPSIAKYEIIFSPGNELIKDTRFPSRWDVLIDLFGEWTINLKNEIEVVDKWENLKNQFNEFDLKNDGYGILNSKFTAQEFIELKSKVNTLQEGISKLSLPPEQIKLINNKLDQITEQAIHLGRFDWRSYFIGTLTTLVMQLSLSQETGKAIWQLAKEAFQTLFLN
jgi:hypothetical protein